MIKVPSNDLINNIATKDISIQIGIKQCLGVVLAGGLSSRMGVDKASLVRNEVNMLSYSKRLLTDAGINNIVISGKTSTSNTQDNVILDIYQKAGPVGGIASIIQQCKPSALLILPVDLPLMTFSALHKLKQIGEISQQACFYENSSLPLYLPITAHLENFIENAFMTASSQPVESKSKNKELGKKGPSMRALLNQIPHKAIKIENSKTLFNSNTPEQWKVAQANFSTIKSNTTETSRVR